MQAAGDKRLSIVWIVLSGVTLVSWWIGFDHHTGPLRLNAPITFGVLSLAALKARIIIQEFMEARRAPRLLRRITDAWLLLLLLSLLGIYGIGMGLHL
jgi:hypothetical protein